MTRKLKLVGAALCAGIAGLSVPAGATPTYTGSGPGTFSVGSTGGENASLTYSDNLSSGTWTLSAIADHTGSQTFDYDSSGFYAFFNVTASAVAFSGATNVALYSTGPANCCSAPSSGFHYTGSVVLDLVEGQAYGFTISGHNSDSNHTIAGTFTIDSPEAVPEPAMLGLFGLGAIGLGLSRRRKAA